MKRIKTIIQSLTAVRREGLVFFVLALPAAALAQVGPGNALSFNGGDQSVVVPGFGTNGPTTEVTVEFWIKPSALTNQFIFSLSGSSMSANFLSLGQLNWSFGIGGPDHVSYVPAMSPGTWQHFALVGHSGGYLYIYRNGVLEAQKFTVLNPISQGNHDLLIAAGGGANFAGQIDELEHRAQPGPDPGQHDPFPKPPTDQLGGLFPP
ncbi:MAG: hypothetical protein NT154_39685 [Verrucomicrobia bacterium]|nr:hypothetical protein [Verrucomicrobiota bacterium]